jgi:hypothetical protein
VVLEEDGTEVDEDVFEFLENGTTLMILCTGEEWAKHVEGISFNICTVPYVYIYCNINIKIPRIKAKYNIYSLNDYLNFRLHATTFVYICLHYAFVMCLKLIVFYCHYAMVVFLKCYINLLYKLINSFAQKLLNFLLLAYLFPIGQSVTEMKCHW